MRRRKDPIPPGAEIYWGHRASFAVLGWMLTLPALFLAAIFGFVALAYGLGGRQIMRCSLAEALQSDYLD